MKTPLFLLLMILTGTGALAQVPESELEKQAARESSWSKESIPFKEVTGSVTVLRTETGTLRLLEVAPELSAAIKISGAEGSFRGVKTSAQLRKTCQSLASAIDLEIENGNKFKIEAMLNPLNENDLSGFAFENKVLQSQIEARLVMVNGSSPLVTQPRLRQLQAELNQIVDTQKMEIARTGILKSVWKGIDDLACDLALGQVVLQVQLITRFEAAQLRRKEVMTAAQIRSVVERLKQMPIAEQSPESKILSRYANLGAVLQVELGGNFQAFMVSKFHKLYGQLISTTDSAVLPMSESDAFKTARKLDDLNYGKDTNQSILTGHGEWTYSYWGIL